MSEPSPGLFTPITLGKRTLRNRIVFLPHATGQGVQGLPSEGHLAYYSRRAEGGVGMIIQEATPVHQASLSRPTHVQGYDPRIIAPARKISDAVHKAGAMMLVQISHRGLAALPVFSHMPVWAPSPSRSPHTGEMAHALTVGEIREVVAGFVQTARNFIDGGYDGVEIHATHGHLLNSFMNPQLNWRNDAYGGSVENRMRLLIEVLEALRTLPLGILGIRLGAPAWNTGPEASDAATIIHALEPYVDYISVTGGTQATKHLNMGDMYSKPAYMLELAQQVKRMTSRPVIAAGRLNDPSLAASVIESGSVDLVGLARGLICDPDWARKVQQQAVAEIRVCIACNTCVDRAESGGPIGCIYNPRTGREGEVAARPATQPVAAGKHVLVVGGGPAGMQAALRAEELGLRVTLADADSVLGGQIALCASVPGREGFQQIADYLREALARSQVKVVLGKRVGPGAPEFASYDGVIVATGASPAPMPDSPAISIPRFRAEEILRNPSLAKGERALIVIDEGMTAGPGAAELLALRGVEVHVVIAGLDVGSALPYTNRRMLMDRLLALPLHWHFQSTLQRVDKSGKATLNVRGAGEVQVDAAFAFVVQTVQRSADSELIAALESAGGTKYAAAGDCVAPRNIYNAIREGFDAADRLAAALSQT